MCVFDAGNHSADLRMTYQDTSKREEARKYFWPGIRQQKNLFKRKRVPNTDISRNLTGYLYCVVCDSKMDTEIMWGNHINGNRHFLNSQNFEYSNEEPSIQKELDKETRAIVGLDYVYEILHSDKLTVYQCLLCLAGLMSTESLIKHLMGLAHQMAFLKDHKKEKFSRLHSSELTKSEMEQVVQMIISKYERKHGRGRMFVMKPKNSSEHYTSAYKKHFDSAKYKWLNPKYSNYFSPQKPVENSPIKSAGMEEKNSESEMKNLPIRVGYGKSKDVAKPYYSDAKIYKSVEPKSKVYRRGQTYLDSKLERDSFYKSERPSRYKGRSCRDLRVYLEQKKNIKATVNVEKSNMDTFTFPSTLSEINNDSDILSRLIEDISPNLFLGLVLFKLEKMDIKKEVELRLLSSVSNKASALALKVKKNILDENLKAKCNETSN